VGRVLGPGCRRHQSGRGAGGALRVADARPSPRRRYRSWGVAATHLGRAAILALKEAMDLVPRHSGLSGAVQFDVLAQQAIGSADAWAHRRDERCAPEHLVVVLIDQSSPPVVGALVRAGVDEAALRRVAMEALGAPGQSGPIALVGHWHDQRDGCGRRVGRLCEPDLVHDRRRSHLAGGPR